MERRTQSSHTVFYGSPGNKGSKTDSRRRTEAMMMKSSSLSSMRSLRDGKVQAFNPRINDNFPFLHTQKPSHISLPVISLPRIVSMDPSFSKMAAEEAKKREQDRLQLGSRKRNTVINPLDLRFKPNTDLISATNQEREYIKEFLHISDALLRDVDDLEEMRLKKQDHEECLISSFTQARYKELRKVRAQSPTPTVMTDTGVSLGRCGDMSMSQITMGDSVVFHQDASLDGSYKEFTTVGENSGEFAHTLSFETNDRRMSSSAKLPSMNFKQFGSNPLDVASNQLSPTWAIRSFVGLTGGGSQTIGAMEGHYGSMYDLDNISVDGSMTTEVTMNTIQTKNRGGDTRSRKNVSIRRTNGSTKSMKPIKRSSSFKDINDMSAEDMKSELMSSLLNMQKHTVMVQENILHVQDLVSIRDQKAKDTIATMAADRMKTALWNVIVKELKRGWDAWIIVFRAESRNAASKHIDRFLKLRNLAFLVRRLVLKKISKLFTIWTDANSEHTKFLEKQRRFKAAQSIQKIARGMITRLGTEERRRNAKYRKMYYGCLTIQKIIRGKLIRWKYLAARLKRIQAVKVIICQRWTRGHLARCRVWQMKQDLLEIECSIKLQCMVRKRAAYNIIREKRAKHKLVVCATKIQSIWRMAIARKNVKKIAKEAHRNKMAIKIQKRARGLIARINIQRHKRKLEAERQFRLQSVINIQKVYRGHRGRTYFRVKAVDYFRKRKIEKNAATIMCNLVRKFLAKCLATHLRKERFDGWVAAARKWQETKAEDGVNYFYLNTETGETLWEPPEDGYIKEDGLFLLASGETIVNPAFAGMSKEEEYYNNRVCSECSDNIAIRKCDECGDKFCVPCFKKLHLVGTRRTHVWKPLGPIECSDCETQLAERWCVTCDEAFCDACWRIVHAKGKRRFHPFSEVDISGKIDPRLFTIDGERVENGYDTTYASQQVDDQQAESWMPQAFDYDPNAASYDPNAEAVEEWTMYYDAENNPYWYNNYTYQSQYEDPYGGQGYDQAAAASNDQPYYGYG